MEPEQLRYYSGTSGTSGWVTTVLKPNVCFNPVVTFNSGGPMLFEIAIVELASDGKATGNFEVVNIIATDVETAKLKVAAKSDLMAKLLPGYSVKIGTRAF